MTYGLDEFCADLHRILKEKRLAGLPEIADKLKTLAVNPAFVAETFEGSSASQRVLFTIRDGCLCPRPCGAAGKGREPAQPRRVLGHICEFTRRHPDDGMAARQSESEDQAVLEVSDRYGLGPGQSRLTRRTSSIRPPIRTVPGSFA